MTTPQDLLNKELCSSCCSAAVYEFGDAYMCADCKEWCDTEEEE